jgi:tetratricopeptide (TPR) repeat protein
MEKHGLKPMKTIAAAALLLAAGQARATGLRQAADPGNTTSKDYASSSAEALVRRDDAKALDLANEALKADDRNPWAHYDRAVALGEMGRVNEAVTEYQAAQVRYAANDTWGRSVAIYGRAHLLADHGRCGEAKTAFQQYIDFVGGADPRGVAEARSASEACP